MAKKKSRGQDEGHKEAGTSSRAGTAGVPVVPVVGLVNLGNTCFLNSILQLLAACEACTAILLQRPGPGDPAPAKGPLGFALQQAIMHMQGRTSTGGMVQGRATPGAYNPQALHAALVRAAPQFKGHQQHDAQEALHALLDNVHEEAAKLHALMHRPSGRRSSKETPAPCISPANSSVLPSSTQGSTAETEPSQAGPAEACMPVTPKHHATEPELSSVTSASDAVVSEPVSLTSALFKGTLLSAVTCSTCEYASVSSEACLELSLPIPDKQQLQQVRNSSNLAGLYAHASSAHAASSCASPRLAVADSSDADAVTAPKQKQLKKKGVKVAVKGKGGKDKSAASSGGASTSNRDDGLHDTGSKDMGDNSQGPRDSASNKKASQISIASKETPKERKKRLAEEKRAAIQARRQARKQEQNSDSEAGTAKEEEDVVSKFEQNSKTGEAHEALQQPDDVQQDISQTGVQEEEKLQRQGLALHSHEQQQQQQQVTGQEAQSPRTRNTGVQLADNASNGLLVPHASPAGSVTCTYVSGFEISPSRMVHVAEASRSSSNVSSASMVPCIGQLSELLKQSQHRTPAANERMNNAAAAADASGPGAEPASLLQVDHLPVEQAMQQEQQDHVESRGVHEAAPGQQASTATAADNPATSGQQQQQQQQRFGNSDALDHWQQVSDPTVDFSQPDLGSKQQHQDQRDQPPQEDRQHDSEQRSVQSPAWFTLRPAVPHLVDCLALFFQPEPIIWECPKEKQEARSAFEQLSEQVLATTPPSTGQHTASPSEHVLHVLHAAQGLAVPPIVLEPPPISPATDGATTASDVSSQHRLVALSVDTSHTLNGATDGEQGLSQPQDRHGGSMQPQHLQHAGSPMRQSQFGFASQGYNLDSPQKPQQGLPSPVRSSPLALQLSIGSPQLSLQRSLLGTLSPGQSLRAPLSPGQSLPMATSLSQLVKKKVRFSPLPPTVHHIPGSREQRGTDLEAALRGEVPFSRPARAPLPAAAATPSAMRAALRSAKNSGKKGKGKKDHGKGEGAGAVQPQEGQGSGQGTGGGSGQADEEGASRFLKSQAQENANKSSKDKKSSKGKGKNSKADSEKGSKKKGGKKKESVLDSSASDDGVSSDEASTACKGAKVPANGVAMVGAQVSQKDGEHGDDQWLEGAAQQLNAEDAAQSSSGGAVSGTAGQQQVFVKGLLIEAQLDRQDLNMLKVRLVPGSTADEKEVAAVMPKGRRGTALCRADIKAAWTHHQKTSKLSASNGSMNAGMTASMQQALDQARPHEQGNQDQLASSGDSETSMDGRKDLGGGRVRTRSQTRQAASRKAQKAYDPSWLSESENETDEEQQLQDEAMCDVCDAVQVVMDCAAHMLLVKGVLAATRALGSGEPLSVVHEAGEWRVHGTDNDTKLPWVYPALHATSSETTHVSNGTVLRAQRPDSPRLAYPGNHAGPIAAAAALTSEGSNATTSSFCITAADHQGTCTGCSCEPITPRLLGGHQDEHQATAPSVSVRHADEAGSERESETLEESTATVAHAPLAIPARWPEGAAIPAPQDVAVASNGPYSSGACGFLPGTSPAGSASRLKKPSDSMFRRPATKAYTLKVAPRVLLLHLKRFRQKGHGTSGVWAKLDSHVDIPLELDISHFMNCAHAPHPAAKSSGPSMAANGQAEGLGSSSCDSNKRYELAGLVEHQGSLRFGHYVAYVRRALQQQQAGTNTEASCSNAYSTQTVGSHASDAPCDDTQDGGGHVPQQGVSMEKAASRSSADNQVGSIMAGKHGHSGGAVQWYRISDASVTRVSEQQVLSAQAYLLMYVQVE